MLALFDEVESLCQWHETWEPRLLVCILYKLISIASVQMPTDGNLILDVAFVAVPEAALGAICHLCYGAGYSMLHSTI